ncbi:MAG: hypothetical protein NTX50_10325 [Candidatus Sumerlaeota bacterium]|nr:hypothetical protein [Candidatus Sumerlaeota bacterium]
MRTTPSVAGLILTNGRKITGIKKDKLNSAGDHGYGGPGMVGEKDY